MDSKKKVLHIIGSMNRGGAEQLIMSIYREIDLEKYQFDFAVQTDKFAYFDQEILDLGGRIFSQPSPSIFGILKYVNSLINIIKKHGPYDCIHSHVFSFSGLVLFVGKIMKVPVRIAHSHTTNDNKGFSIYRTFYKRIMRKLILNSATNLVGCSKEACISLFGENAFKKGMAIVLPNAIKIDSFQNIDNGRNDLREELNIPLSSKIVGHVGRFSKQKNHDFLINVFYEILKKIPDTHLVLVGDGDLKEKMERLVSEKRIAQYVHFLGLRDDVPQIMSSLDLFLFPSLYEGLGIVLIEAQAAGIPCLISNNLPSEADIGLGLIKSLDLTSEPKVWAIHAINIMNTSNPVSWEVRNAALKKNGYCIESTVNQLVKIYSM